MRRDRIVGILTVVLGLASLARADEPATAEQASTPPPKDAIVLFDGTNLDQWTKIDGKTPADWTIKDGYTEGVPATGAIKRNDIQTKQKFKDYHLHLEFWLPPTPGATGEKKANSGVYLQQFYEIQILDSYGTPQDGLKKGDCGAVYRQKAPDENACLPPEQWQSFDIDFKSARFDDQHNKLSKAVVSVVQNGKQVQKDVEIDAATRAGVKEPMDNNEDVIILQYHGHPVRFRNIWIVEKKENQ